MESRNVNSGHSAYVPNAKIVSLAPAMLERMTTVEIREAIDSGRTTILIPNASTDATGLDIAPGKHLVCGAAIVGALAYPPRELV